MAIAMVLFHGMIGSNFVFIADEKKADLQNLQAVLRNSKLGGFATPVLVTKLVGRRFSNPAVKLLRPLCGRPEAGDD